ncbi:zinc finger, CCHC-type containing protein [Tanacetum coccineum]
MNVDTNVRKGFVRLAMENNYPLFLFLALVSPMSQVVKAAWEFVFEIVSVYKVHSSSFLGWNLYGWYRHMGTKASCQEGNSRLFIAQCNMAEMRVGQIRSTIVRDMLARMLEFSKVDVLRRNHGMKPFLAAFLENPRKRKLSNEAVGTATKPSFIVYDMNGDLRDDDFITKETEDSKFEYDDEANHFDSVCAICDNGGGLLWMGGANYTTWAIRMQIILEANGLWEIIEPNETTQADNKKDKTATAFIYQALSEEQLLQITKHKTAKAIWDALKTRHI